jgi:hypothetical protein
MTTDTNTMHVGVAVGERRERISRRQLLERRQDVIEKSDVVSRLDEHRKGIVGDAGIVFMLEREAP